MLILRVISHWRRKGEEDGEEERWAQAATFLCRPRLASIFLQRTSVIMEVFSLQFQRGTGPMMFYDVIFVEFSQEGRRQLLKGRARK